MKLCADNYIQEALDAGMETENMGSRNIHFVTVQPCIKWCFLKLISVNPFLTKMENINPRQQTLAAD
jgi:hypothetical protein